MKKLLLLFVAILAFSLNTQAQNPVQKVLIEEFTGAWCGYCADGALILDQILDQNPDVIGISIHNGDAMVTANGNYVQNFYGPAFPQAVINRNGAPVSRGSWQSAANQAMNANNPVSVSLDSVSFDPNLNILFVTVKATYTDVASGNMRLNLILAENNVTGSGSGYDQVNYYNGDVNHPHYNLGNPMVGFVHNHVVRSMEGNAWGTNGVIPSSVNGGESYSKEYGVWINPNWKWEDLYLVGTVNRYDGQLVYQREIMNVEQAPLTALVGLDDPASPLSGMEITPNPASERATVTFSLEKDTEIKVEVLNTLGQHIATLAEGFMSSGSHSASWNGTTETGAPSSNGIYMVRLVTQSGQSLTKRMMLAR